MVQSNKRIVDSYLVACAQMGNRTAQEQLVMRYQNKFIRHAYRLIGQPELAKDAVQEGWLDILRGLPKLKDEAAFAAWAFRIITRKCAKQISGLQKNRTIIEAIEGEPEPANQAAVDAQCDSSRQLVQQALATLSAEHRATISLFYLEEMSVAEVAVALEIPVGTVKTRLMYARKKLRATLEGEHYG